MRATVKDVAIIAGVSPTSVSRVLGGHPNVTPALRAKVLSAVEECNYRPDFRAVGLRGGPSKTIGVLIWSMTNYLFADVIKGIEQELRSSGYSIILTHSDGIDERDIENLELLKERHVDGLILSMADEGNKQLITSLRDTNVPIVLLNREIPELDGLSIVKNQTRQGMRDLTDGLLDRGHERIGLISGPQGMQTARERRAGFTDAFAERGMKLDRQLVISDRLSVDYGERATRELLSLTDPPTALISGSNVTISGVLRSLSQLGLKVGSDIAVASCDEVPLTELYDPPISVIDRDMRDLGTQAADLLLELLEQPETSARTVSLPTSIIWRPSTPGNARSLTSEST